MLCVGVQPLRQLAHRQAVPHWDRRPAHEAGVVQVKERAFDGVAAERVGAVEHNHGDSRRGTRLQASHHRPGERVDPRTDVLQIDDQAFQSPGAWPAWAFASRCRGCRRARRALRLGRARFRSCSPAAHPRIRAAARTTRRACRESGGREASRHSRTSCSPTPGSRALRAASRSTFGGDSRQFSSPVAVGGHGAAYHFSRLGFPALCNTLARSVTAYFGP